MSNTSETRCKQDQQIYPSTTECISGQHEDCSGRGPLITNREEIVDCKCKCHEPTPPEVEADPLSPLLDMRVVEGLSEELRKAKAEGEAVPEQKETKLICDGCNVRSPFEHRCHGSRSVVAGEFTNLPCECLECKEPPVPVVSTAAPESPKCVLLRCTCGQVSYVTEAELIGMDRGTVYSCPKCGLALTSASKTNKSRSTVAPEPECPICGKVECMTSKCKTIFSCLAISE